MRKFSGKFDVVQSNWKHFTKGGKVCIVLVEICWSFKLGCGAVYEKRIERS